MNTSTTTPKDVSAFIDMENLMNPVLVLTFADGETLCIQPSMLSVAIAQQAMMHGLKQKLVDATAISRNPDTGRSASVADKKQACLEVFNRIIGDDGTWNKTREGGTATGGLLFRALCIAYPNKSSEVLREYLGKRSTEEKATLRVKFADIIATLKVPTEGTDVDAMLSELDD